MTNEKHWYIAIVPNNTEKSSAAKLSSADCEEVFVPSQKVVSVWKDGRRKIREKILLPGKILVYCTEAERLALCNYSFIRRFMVDIASAPNQFGHRSIAVIPDHQMEMFKFVLGMDEKVEISNTNLKIGEKVRVMRGALMGLEGIVTYNGSATKLHINIDYLGCASVVININDIERLT